MDDAYAPQQIATENPADGNLVQVAAMAPWQASLALAFAAKDGRTSLTKKQHQGPLVIQKVLYPEGHAVCHGIIVHPPGGVAGGDALTLAVQLAEDANALLTTPGAAKWYKANGREASQLLKFDLAPGASLEWLPQENILFDGAMLDLSAEINLANEATYAGWEILCFGRQASNEQWQAGRLKQKLVIRRHGTMIWQERAFLSPASKVMSAMAGLGGNVISGSFVVVAGLLPAEVLAACREVMAEDSAKVAVTALPEIFSARYIGQSSQSARHYFEALWHILRPWYASRQATRPRIWNT
ncbi:MAG: urease accessory protein UreD [Methylophilaceae bacterium]